MNLPKFCFLLPLRNKDFALIYKFLIGDEKSDEQQKAETVNGDVLFAQIVWKIKLSQIVFSTDAKFEQ